MVLRLVFELKRLLDVHTDLHRVAVVSRILLLQVERDVQRRDQAADEVVGLLDLLQHRAHVHLLVQAVLRLAEQNCQRLLESGAAAVKRRDDQPEDLPSAHMDAVEVFRVPIMLHGRQWCFVRLLYLSFLGRANRRALTAAGYQLHIAALRYLGDSAERRPVATRAQDRAGLLAAHVECRLLVRAALIPA